MWETKGTRRGRRRFVTKGRKQREGGDANGQGREEDDDDLDNGEKKRTMRSDTCLLCTSLHAVDPPPSD